METFFICPKCSEHLKIRDNIVLLAQKKNKRKVLVFLSPELGNYDVYYHSDSVKFEKDEEVDLFCPICGANLSYNEKNKNLAHLVMIDANGEKSDVFFSNRYGERATYKVKGEKIDKYGDDIDKNIFWGYSL